MLKIRLVICALAVALGLAVRAEMPLRGEPKARLDDNATRQAQLKRAYESFRQQVALLANRLELSGERRDRDRARALRNVLAEASTRSLESKFDALLRGLTKKGVDQDLDTLNQIARENKELAKDLAKLLELISNDDRARFLAERRDRVTKLLAELRELRNKQSRLQAQTERERRPAGELKKEQEKISAATRHLFDRKSNPAAVREPLNEAGKQQKDAERKLGKGDRDGAASSQGRAVGNLDEAIRRLEEIVRQVRQEERERNLTDLLARCKRMLGIQQVVEAGSKALYRERLGQDGKPTLAQAARSNKLADRQNDSLKEAAATLKLLRTEGSAAAFAEVFEQLGKDMDVIHNRLSRGQIDMVTLTIEDDVIQTLKEAIAALEKAVRPEGPRRPPEGGPRRKPGLVDRLQQLKMVHALQRRVNERTTLYGKRYRGEQAPAPRAARTDGEKARREQIQKELKDLADRQDRIARVTREIGKEQPETGRRID